MGKRTLSTFQSDLMDALGRPNIDPSRMTRWVNDAYREIAYAFKFQEMQGIGTVNTTQAQPSYALAADYRSMGDTGVQITSPQTAYGGTLIPEARANYRKSVPYPMAATQGNPRWYHIYQQKIWLRPWPDSTARTIEYDYWKSIVELVNPNDTSVLNDDWDEAIFRGALYRGQLVYGEHDRMINTFNLFLGLIRTRVAVGDLEEFPEGGISVIESQFANATR